MEEKAQTAQELREVLKTMLSQKPHEVFGVWEGCGSDIVRDAFYVLVKRHHPDLYAADVDEIRQLAQEIFLIIQKAYGKLRSVEKQQLVPAPPVIEEHFHDALNRLAQRSESIGNALSQASHALSQASEAYESMAQDVAAEQVTSRMEDASQASSASDRATPDSFEGESLVGDERRAKLASLSQKRSTRIPVRNHFSNDMGLSTAKLGAELSTPEERATKLAALANKRREVPSDFIDAFRQSRSTTQPSFSSEGLSSSSSSPTLHTSSSPSLLPTSGLKLEDVIRTSESLQDMSHKKAFHIGYQEFKLRRYEPALTAFRRAYDVMPENGLYLTFYGYTLFQVQGHDAIKEAERYLRLAVASDHRQAMPDAHLFLGYVCKELGGRFINESVIHFERALELNPESHEARREIRLFNMRKDKPTRSESKGFFKKLFNKE